MLNMKPQAGDGSLAKPKYWQWGSSQMFITTVTNCASPPVSAGKQISLFAQMFYYTQSDVNDALMLKLDSDRCYLKP
ncbi:hypothetical protein EXN66_Car006930 [Channa argus]|uniref:Uncharacterized protein n=1 Tax=Channa argus TaxID=215402 RepID=A0A6G1PLU2_CHAAH|nr:hypothetical protein EXN66_Car006930 [Channa argus]